MSQDKDADKNYQHLLKLCREYGKIWRENGGPEEVKARHELERKRRFVWAA